MVRAAATIVIDPAVTAVTRHAHSATVVIVRRRERPLSLQTAIEPTQTAAAYSAAAEVLMIPFEIFSRQNRSSLSQINPARSFRARANIKSGDQATTKRVIF
jgi:hypothetical protein